MFIPQYCKNQINKFLQFANLNQVKKCHCSILDTEKSDKNVKQLHFTKKTKVRD